MNTLHRFRFIVMAAIITVMGLRGTSTALAAGPGNDDFGTASLISPLPFTAQLDTSQATTAPDDPYCASNGGTVWYAFTAPPSGTITALDANTFGSSYDTTLSVYTGTRGNLTQVACNDDAGGTVQSQVRFNVVAGQTYYLMVAAFGSGIGGNLALTVAQPPPPPGNDNFTTPTAITSLPFTDTMDTSNATAAADDPWCGGNNNSVWYSYTATQNEQLVVDTTGSSYITTESIYTGSRGSLTQLSCDTWQSRVHVTVTAGQTYSIMISSGYGSGGNLTLSASVAMPPANDDFTSPTIVAGIPFSTTEDTSYATTAPDDPTSCSWNTSAVWFAYTAAQNQRIEVNTNGSSYPTIESVYTGTRGNLTQVACDTWRRWVRFDVSAGQTYYVMIGSSYGNGGTLNLSVVQAPPAFSIQSKVNPMQTVVPQTGVVTISGTVTCNQATPVWIYGQIRQKVGGRYTIGNWFGTFFWCNGTTSWSTPVASSNGPFKPGPVIGLVSVSAINPEADQYMSLPPSPIIRLKGT